KRRLSVGGKTAGIRSGLKSSAVEKIRRHSTEDILVALLLRHHQLTFDLLEQVPVEDIHDARNRELIDILKDPATFELEGADLAIAMDDELADHAEALIEMLAGRPEQFPSHIRTETSKVLEKLRVERFRYLTQQLVAGIKAAEA